MPWTVDDVDKHNKGLSDKQKRQWVAVANDARSRCLSDGGTESECDASAIRQANGAVKRGDFVEFSMTIKKASVDPKSGEMRWKADTSDIDDDSHNDSMSLELYTDFLDHIERGDLVPEQFRSEFWSGGTPYLSISHYSDQNGEAVPGVVDAVYVDGKFLKAKGRFYDTPLGKACFNALCEDLKNGEDKPKVRVSIGFLDWAHRHKSNGYVFERKDLTDFCPECLKELIEDGRI